MTNKMNLIFEPADLEQASPATVSRCGMIYMEPSQLGWQSLQASYHNVISKKMLEEQFELIEELSEWLIPATITFIKTHCKQFVHSSELHMYFVSSSTSLEITGEKDFDSSGVLFQSYSRLFSCMLEGESQVSTTFLQCTFFFCVVWGFASTITGKTIKYISSICVKSFLAAFLL